MQSHPIITEIQKSKHLPRIPKAFGQSLNMLLEPFEYNIDACTQRLSNVPGLESTLIQMLNLNTRLNRKFLTLKDVVVYLGAKNVRLIAVAYITRRILPNKKGRAKLFNNRRYWKHCIATAIAGYLIADKTGLCDKDKIFTYGLIHDIGITLLDICLPQHLDRIYTMQLERGLHHIAAEKIVLNGATHTEVGKWICNEWGLPEEIQDIVAYHHSPLIDSKFNNEVRVMYLADSISTYYYERLLGTANTFIYSDNVRKMLNVSKGSIEEIASQLPKEVDRVDRVIEFV